MGSVQDQLEKEIDLLRRQLQDEIHHSQRLKLTVDRLTKEAQANQLAPGEGLRDHRTWRGEAVDGEAFWRVGGSEDALYIERD